MAREHGAKQEALAARGVGGPSPAWGPATGGPPRANLGAMAAAGPAGDHGAITTHPKVEPS